MEYYLTLKMYYTSSKWINLKMLNKSQKSLEYDFIYLILKKAEQYTV